MSPQGNLGLQPGITRYSSFFFLGGGVPQGNLGLQPGITRYSFFFFWGGGVNLMIRVWGVLGQLNEYSVRIVS